MNAVAAQGPSKPVVSAAAIVLWRGAVFILMALTAANAFAADAQETEAVLLAQAELPATLERNRPQLEVSSASLPRFEIDGAVRTSRIDMTYMPPRRSALGLSLGMTSPEAAAFSPAPATAPLLFAPASASPQSMDLGVTWRYTTDGNLRVDVSAWRRMMPADALTMVQIREPNYGARVEMRLGGGVPKGGFVAERGFLGLQLESGARVTLRRSGGKPMVYYRSKF